MKLFLKKHKKTFLMLGAIVVLGAFLRFYNLGANSFVADEFLDINSSYAYFKTGQWTNWNFNEGKVNENNIFAPRDERAWMYKWQVAQVFRFLAPTEEAARTVSALWGILTILIMYYAGWYFSKKKSVGLLSAFLFAVSVAGISLDRRLRMYAMFFPLFLLLSIFLYRFFEEAYVGSNKLIKKVSDKFGLNIIWLIPFILVGALSMHIHDLTINIVPIFGTYVFVRMLVFAKKGKPMLNKYSVSVVLGLLLSGLAWAAVPEKLGTYLAGVKFFNDNYSYLSIIFGEYGHVLIGLIVYVCGLFYLARKRKMTKETLWLAISFLVPLLSAIFIWRRNVGAQYIFFAQSFVIIVSAAGIVGIANFFKENMPEYKKKAMRAALIVMVLLVPNYGYFFQENNTYHQNSKAENPNYRSIFTYVKKKRLPGDVVVTRNFRNYYLSGQNIPVVDFGGELAEEKMSLSQIQAVKQLYQSGWVVLSENDERYISNEAMQFIEENMQKINDMAVRGNALVYRWQ
jgi:hypothetical protein